MSTVLLFKHNPFTVTYCRAQLRSTSCCVDTHYFPSFIAVTISRETIPFQAQCLKFPVQKFAVNLYRHLRPPVPRLDEIRHIHEAEFLRRLSCRENQQGISVVVLQLGIHEIAAVQSIQSLVTSKLRVSPTTSKRVLFQRLH